MTNTLSPEATAHLAAETAAAAEEARGDMLAALAGSNYTAYLAALTDTELASRAKWSRLAGELWDADQFDREIARRNA
ncbi:hypothetical protein [Rhodococcoides fascians]|uniref:hypothetical protein n=1 Tax=Rhodococcoides fascians TaxID=1828 RepID=UPI00055B770C|nr:hypothetical protein [Rhodococcus fascians]